MERDRLSKSQVDFPRVSSDLEGLMRLTSWFLAIFESVRCLLRHHEHLWVAWASDTVSLRSNGGTALLLILSSALLGGFWERQCLGSDSEQGLSARDTHCLVGGAYCISLSSTPFYVVRTLLWSALHPVCLPFLSGCIPAEVKLGKTRDQGWLDSCPPQEILLRVSGSDILPCFF